MADLSVKLRKRMLWNFEFSLVGKIQAPCSELRLYSSFKIGNTVFSSFMNIFKITSCFTKLLCYIWHWF